jgi:hypothetical protein
MFGKVSGVVYNMSTTRRIRRAVMLIIVLVMLFGVSVWVWHSTTPDNSVCEGTVCTTQFELDGELCHSTRDVFGNLISSGCP